MRALCFFEDISQGQRLEVAGEKAHHFIKVVRLKVDEEVLGLSGQGRKYYLRVEKITKKTIIFLCNSIEVIEGRPFHIDIAVSQVKKDAMDLCLKVACELGVKNIYVMNTERSQKYELNMQRVEKLLTSSIEQSNNPFMPTVKKVNLEEIINLDYHKKICFSSVAQPVESLRYECSKSHLLIVGPEGGFSLSEDNLLKANSIDYIHLATPILRTQNAIPCAVGYLLGSMG